MEIPLAPSPSTSTCLFVNAIGTRLLHCRFDVRKAHGPDILRMLGMHAGQLQLPGSGLKGPGPHFLHEQLEVQTARHDSPLSRFIALEFQPFIASTST
jgi:hypothetical protein